MVVNINKIINKLNLHYVISEAAFSIQHALAKLKKIPPLPFIYVSYFSNRPQTVLVFHNSVAQSQCTSISLIESLL